MRILCHTDTCHRIKTVNLDKIGEYVHGGRLHLLAGRSAHKQALYARVTNTGLRD